MRRRSFKMLIAVGVVLVCSAIFHSGTMAGQDGGYAVTDDLWVKAVLQVTGSPVTLIWKMVGADITPSGDQVISGYFYADPDAFAYGSVYNPELFVKIYIATNGWCNIAFNHVTVDDVMVNSAHKYAGFPDQTDTITLSERLSEHQYEGVAIESIPPTDPSDAAASRDNGYMIAPTLWSKAMLQPTSGPVTLIWKTVGSDITPSGDRVVSGYFYANPADFAYGSEFNPEVFVKVYIATNGWCNIAYNHVTVDDVSVYSAHEYAGGADQTGAIKLSARLLEHIYEEVEINPPRLPDTGQSATWTPVYGEDSDYTKNPPSYTKLGAGGEALPDTATAEDGWIMVRDNVTGLIWEVKTDDDTIHDKDNTYTWYDPNPETNGTNSGTPGDGTDTQDFIDALNSANFGGYADWRMPTIKELFSISNYGKYYPAIDPAYFPNTKYIDGGYAYYWSATSSLTTHNREKAWVIYPNGGQNATRYKSESRSVRAVRGKKTELFADSVSPTRLTDNGDGTVTDWATGLMWQQDGSAIETDWEAALTQCDNMTLAGRQDWRLPNIRELMSIVDFTAYDPAIDTTFFTDPNVQGGAHYYYISSTSLGVLSYRELDPWYMDMHAGNGYIWPNLNTGITLIRAVRDIE